MGSLDTTRNSAGVPTGDISTMYAAALAAFPAACKGPYVVDGRDYRPPAPMDLLEVIFRLGNETVSRGQNGGVTPAVPDLGIAQGTFGDPLPAGGGWLRGKS